MQADWSIHFSSPVMMESKSNANISKEKHIFRDPLRISGILYLTYSIFLQYYAVN